VRAEDNPFDLADLQPEQLKTYQTLYVEPILERRRSREIKWCLLRYPSNSLAQLSEMSQEAYTDLYYNVCCLDYARMSAAMDALVDLFEATDVVHIVRPGTDLAFSIKGIPSMKWDGRSNLPDGELMTAPVRDSVNGVITYNTPGLYQGAVFHDVRFVIEEGKIVDASCHGDHDKLNAILDTDGGRATSASSPWVSIRSFFIPVGMCSSRRRLLDRSISRPATATRMPPTAIIQRFTGTWYRSSERTMEAERSTSTTS
jgi:aminopeptidase